MDFWFVFFISNCVIGNWNFWILKSKSFCKIRFQPFMDAVAWLSSVFTTLENCLDVKMAAPIFQNSVLQLCKSLCCCCTPLFHEEIYHQLSACQYSGAAVPVHIRKPIWMCWEQSFWIDMNWIWFIRRHLHFVNDKQSYISWMFQMSKCWKWKMWPNAETAWHERCQQMTECFSNCARTGWGKWNGVKQEICHECTSRWINNKCQPTKKVVHIYFSPHYIPPNGFCMQHSDIAYVCECL